ncbi:MAG: hypothetical protein R3B53_01575 [Candidatus Paceibacterota bacterium]
MIDFSTLGRWERFAVMRALDLLLIFAAWTAVGGLIGIAVFGQLANWGEFLLGSFTLGLVLEMRPKRDPVHRLWRRIKGWL